MVQARGEERRLVIDREIPLIQEFIQARLEHLRPPAGLDQPRHIVRDAQRIDPARTLVEEHFPIGAEGVRLPRDRRVGHPRPIRPDPLGPRGTGPRPGQPGRRERAAVVFRRAIHLGRIGRDRIQPTPVAVSRHDEAAEAVVLVVPAPEVLPIAALPQEPRRQRIQVAAPAAQGP